MDGTIQPAGLPAAPLDHNHVFVGLLASVGDANHMFFVILIQQRIAAEQGGSPVAGISTSG